MKDIIMKQFDGAVLTNKEVEEIEELISNRKSFLIFNIRSSHLFDSLISKIEKSIENKNMKCRVYKENRSVAMAAVVIPTGITQVLGFASAIGIGLHNLATYNPDYEIAKSLDATQLSIVYKK